MMIMILLIQHFLLILLLLLLFHYRLVVWLLLLFGKPYGHSYCFHCHHLEEQTSRLSNVSALAVVAAAVAVESWSSCLFETTRVKWVGCHSYYCEDDDYERVEVVADDFSLLLWMMSCSCDYDDDHDHYER
jgi:hypothetical protein